MSSWDNPPFVNVVSIGFSEGLRGGEEVAGSPCGPRSLAPSGRVHLGVIGQVAPLAERPQVVLGDVFRPMV
jgi:hypothetical protein